LHGVITGKDVVFAMLWLKKWVDANTSGVDVGQTFGKFAVG
jgi:hypothetical protein